MASTNPEYVSRSLNAICAKLLFFKGLSASVWIVSTAVKSGASWNTMSDLFGRVGLTAMIRFHITLYSEPRRPDSMSNSLKSADPTTDIVAGPAVCNSVTVNQTLHPGLLDAASTARTTIGCPLTSRISICMSEFLTNPSDP